MSATGPVVCPKCGHARGATETAPAWQCPACGIAYHKYQSYLDSARKAVTPLHAGDPVPHWSADSSIWSLLAANVLALVAALYFEWTPRSLILLYWVQSATIGVSYYLRIMSLDKFSTEGFTIDKRPVPPTHATKISTAAGFAFMYGFFHLGFLLFLVVGPGDPADLDASFWLCSTAFVFNHSWSYRYNRDIDRMGTPNIGTLSFIPYVRVMPMLAMIAIGAPFIDSPEMLLVVGVMKTLADIGMHIGEHNELRKVQPAAGPH